jgi:Tfp pilus assembly protein PilP
VRKICIEDWKKMTGTDGNHTYFSWHRMGVRIGALLLPLSFFSATTAESQNSEPNEPASGFVEGAQVPNLKEKNKTPSERNKLESEFAPGVEKSNSSLSWDSYLDFTDTDGVANEVTSGIRVEDIVEPPSQYRYAAFGKPDPFIPPMLTGYRSSSLEIPIVSILQRYSTESLRVVGMWELASGERKVLIMTPKDEGIVSKIGDVVGTRGGKIIQIEEKSLKIREFTLAPDGTRQFEDSELFLGSERPDEDGSILMQATGGVSQGSEAREGSVVGFLDRESDVVKRNELTTIKPPPPKRPDSPAAKIGDMQNMGTIGKGLPGTPTGPATTPMTTPNAPMAIPPTSTMAPIAPAASPTTPPAVNPPAPAMGASGAAPNTSAPVDPSKTGNAGQVGGAAPAPTETSRFNSGY